MSSSPTINKKYPPFPPPQTGFAQYVPLKHHKNRWMKTLIISSPQSLPNGCQVTHRFFITWMDGSHVVIGSLTGARKVATRSRWRKKTKLSMKQQRQITKSSKISGFGASVVVNIQHIQTFSPAGKNSANKSRVVGVLFL